MNREREGGEGGVSLCWLPKSERVQSEAFAKSNIKYLFAMHAFVWHFIYYTQTETEHAVERDRHRVE